MRALSCNLAVCQYIVQPNMVDENDGDVSVTQQRLRDRSLVTHYLYTRSVRALMR